VLVSVLTTKDVCDWSITAIKCYVSSVTSPDLRGHIRNVSIRQEKSYKDRGKVMIVSNLNYWMHTHNLFKSEAIYCVRCVWALALRILRSGDVHCNPGPNKKLLIGSFNVRGANDRLKTKRLLNYVATKNKFDRYIYSFYETHLTEKRRSEIEYGWRGEFLLSPGAGNARGVLTLYKATLFDTLLYSHADPSGRTTWLAGTFDNKNDLFVSIYAPNFGSNKEYFESIFKEIESVKTKYNIDNTFVLGDFNIDIWTSDTKR